MLARMSRFRLAVGGTPDAIFHGTAHFRILRRVLITKARQTAAQPRRPHKETQFSSMTKLPAPRGRPPLGCFWVGDNYIDQETGEEITSARNKQRARQRRHAYERARYWDIATKARLKRLERAARESGRQARPMQLRLDDLLSGRADSGRSDGPEQKPRAFTRPRSPSAPK